MTISEVELLVPNAERVTITKDTLTVDLSDGRTISAPLALFFAGLKEPDDGMWIFRHYSQEHPSVFQFRR